MRRSLEFAAKGVGFGVFLILWICPVQAADLTFPDGEFKDVEIVNLHKGSLAFRCLDGNLLIKPLRDLTTLSLPWKDTFNQAEQKLARKEYIGAIAAFQAMQKEKPKGGTPVWFAPLVEGRIARAKKLQAGGPGVPDAKNEVTCDLCKGARKVPCQQCKNGRILCPDCKGQWCEECKTCDGRGKLVERSFFYPKSGKTRYIYVDCPDCKAVKVYGGKYKGLTDYCKT